MIPPTFWEAITLWVLFSIVGAFFFGLGRIITINVIVFILIIAGFFMGMGIELLNAII